jgi:retinol dehydrogenase 12
MLHPVYKGGWTELYAGWSPDITPALNGCFVVPWGRIGSYNGPLKKAAKTVENGGEGLAEKLWQACENACREYM